MFGGSYFRDAGDSLNDCRIKFVDEIYKIEEPGSTYLNTTESPQKRELIT